MKKQTLILLITGAALAVACGGGGGSSTPATAQETPQNAQAATNPGQATTPVTSTNQAIIEQMEKDGKLPILDRSTDIKGPDTDNNGIRDDIDVWIGKQPYTEPQRKAAQQLARSSQKTLLADLNNTTSLQEIDEQESLAVKCVMTRYNQNGYEIVTTIEKYTANTKARVVAYLKYNAAQNGTTSKSPEGDGCVE